MASERERAKELWGERALAEAKEIAYDKERMNQD